MKQQIATTREQADRLLKCGVPAESADMCLSTRTKRSDGSFIAKKHQTTNLWIGYPCWRATSGDEELENIPAWSLSALLTTVLPSNIRFEGHTCILEIVSSNWQSDEQIWEVAYDIDLGVEASDPIEACVLMVEKLTANNYQLNEIEEGGEA